MSLNRDALVAVFFLFLCGSMFIATLSLPEAMFNQMSPALWPRIILVPLALLSAVLLVKSQRSPAGAKTAERPRFGDWLRSYRNPILCFVLFFLFLATMPVLGMLLGGLLYVFLTLSVLGGWRAKQLVLHAAISAFFVIGMWAVFTLMLGVFLPEGIILRVH